MYPKKERRGRKREEGERRGEEGERRAESGMGKKITTDHPNIYMHHLALVRPVETLQKCMDYIQNMNRIAADIMDLPAEDSSEVIFHKLTKSAGV